MFGHFVRGGWGVGGGGVCYTQGNDMADMEMYNFIHILVTDIYQYHRSSLATSQY